MKHEKEFITSMSTNKIVEENAMQDLSDQKLAQLSGGILDSTLAPVVGTVLQTVGAVPGALSGTTLKVGGVEADTALGSVKAGGVNAVLGGGA